MGVEEKKTSKNSVLSVMAMGDPVSEIERKNESNCSVRNSNFPYIRCSGWSENAPPQARIFKYLVLS